MHNQSTSFKKKLDAYFTNGHLELQVHCANLCLERVVATDKVNIAPTTRDGESKVYDRRMIANVESKAHDLRLYPDQFNGEAYFMARNQGPYPDNFNGEAYAVVKCEGLYPDQFNGEAYSIANCQGLYPDNFKGNAYYYLDNANGQTEYIRNVDHNYQNYTARRSAVYLDEPLAMINKSRSIVYIDEPPVMMKRSSDFPLSRRAYEDVTKDVRAQSNMTLDISRQSPPFHNYQVIGTRLQTCSPSPQQRSKIVPFAYEHEPMVRAKVRGEDTLDAGERNATRSGELPFRAHLRAQEDNTTGRTFRVPSSSSTHHLRFLELIYIRLVRGVSQLGLVKTPLVGPKNVEQSNVRDLDSLEDKRTIGTSAHPMSKREKRMKPSGLLTYMRFLRLT